MALFDGKLKQRLVGASVLIVVAVVFIPIILDNKGARLRNGDKPQDVSVQVPKPPVQPVIITATQNSNKPVSTENSGSHIPTNTNTNVTQAVPNNNTNTNPNTSPTNNTSPPPKPTVSKPNEKGITPTWSVQLVALSSKEAADKFKDKLRTNGYNAYVRTEGKISRVFVGPVFDKNEAIRLQSQLQKQFNEKGIVREASPEKR